jgi:hypothetical protein
MSKRKRVNLGNGIEGLTMPDNTPIKPGYYWAQWRVPAEGTYEGELMTPQNYWIIVEVWANHIYWDRDPLGDDEALAVSVPGVRETQWRDCFVWGERVPDKR